jgi:hypothetical protein
MSQIEIKILKQGFESKKLFSVSFFTMNDPYRDFTKYQKYLRRFLEYTAKYPDFAVRIYTDDSGKDYSLEVSEGNDQVSIYHFNCPEFKDPDYPGHIGVFGPIPRFLPLFEKHDIVWISDIDIPEHFLDMQILRNKFDFGIFTYPCYFRESFNNKYTIIAHRIISRIQLPRALLTRFLTKLSNGSLNDKVKQLNLENRKKPKSKVPYCTDELFLNTSVYKHLKTYDYKIYIHLDKLLAGLIPGAISSLTQEEDLIVYRYSFYKNQRTEENANKIRHIFKKIFSNFQTKYPCLTNISLDNLEESFIIKSSDL